MKRIQAYLDEEMLKTLRIHARRRKNSIARLVREAVEEKYGSPGANRKEAMMAIVGMWKDRDDLPDSERYVRRLRRGRRLRELSGDGKA